MMIRMSNNTNDSHKEMLKKELIKELPENQKRKYKSNSYNNKTTQL
jgi:hypothetical protein